MASGIPNLLNNVTNAVNQVSLLISDAALIYQKFQVSGWGIYNKDGSVAIVPDSIVALDYHNEWPTSTYPMELGAFQSYNKVQTPFESRITMTKGGSIDDKSRFLAQVDRIGDSLTMFDIITPEQIYADMTIESVDYSRSSSNGASMITLDIGFKEVRFAANAKNSNPKNANDGSVVKTSPIQPQSPMPELTPIT
jgi:hypothetical protein